MVRHSQPRAEPGIETRRHGLWTLAAALAVLAAGGAAADEPSPPAGAVPIATLATAIAAWTATALGQPPAELPRIDFADAPAMARLRYGADAASNGPLGLVALYDDAARTILLPRGWTGATPAELSVLVHEMTHHLQNVSGRTFPCPAAREQEAFGLQARWLGRYGLTLESEFEIDALTLLVLTHCGL
jgi:uncharacterized protein DUF6647